VASILSTSLTALNSYQRALATVGHNIANADVEGYSRQEVLFTTKPPSFSGSGWMGSGVEVSTVERRYDQFLAYQVRTSRTASGESEVYYAYARQLDDLYADPELGLDPVLQRYFNALNGVANDPSSIPARQVLLAEGEALTDRFHFLARRGAEIADGVNRDIAGTVADINTLAKGIAKLNQVIVESGGMSGQLPNDLLDQRDQLINELSSLVKVTYSDQGDGSVNVFVGNGQSLVVGGTAATLGVGLNATNPVIYYYSDGARQDVTEQMTGGRLGGLVQFRSQVLDASMERLDQVAFDLISGVNDVHRDGTALDGVTTGLSFFGRAGVVDPDALEALPVAGAASQIQLAIGDARQVAAAWDGGPADNRNALALAALQREKLAFGDTATVQGAYAQMVADVGSRTRTAELNATAQRGLLMRAEEAHSAVSGVNLDEEAAKLLHYQQAYQAAAQAIAVAQTLFETVIAAMRR
jgi:flagellar hook-associated protein 1 FlgK